MWLLFLLSAILLSISVFLFTKIKNRVDNNKELERQEEDFKKKLKLLDEDCFRKNDELNNIIKRIKEINTTVEDSLTQYSDLLETKYEKVEHEYDTAIDTMKSAYNQEQDKLIAETAKVQADLDNMRATRAAAIQALLKEQEIEDNKDFYTLSIDGQDKREISVIMSIENMLRDSRPLRMLIWSTYFLKKANILCSNVLGPNKITGIYKITSLIDGRCYIGQAVDVKERWRDHMKAGLGIDATSNKFYDVMQEQGIENFTFELLEECPKELLNEKEAFYIDLYQSLNYGFNSTKGNTKKN